MKTTFRIVSITAACVMLALAAWAWFSASKVTAQGEIIGFVESDKILEQYTRAVTVNKELADMKKNSEAELEKRVREKFGDGDVNSLPRESQLEIQKMFEQADEEFQKRSESLRKEKWLPVVDDVNAAIKEICAREKISVVLDKSAVIYGGADITEKVVAQLNKTKK